MSINRTEYRFSIFSMHTDDEEELSSLESDSNEVVSPGFLELDEAEPYPKNRLILSLLVLFSAMAETGMNAVDMHSKAYSTPVLLFTSILYFFSSLGLKRKFTIDGLEDTYQIIRDRSLPADWSSLSVKRNLIAGGLSAITISCVLYNDVALTIKNFHEMPSVYKFEPSIHMIPWDISCIVLSSVFGANMIFGEGKETFRTLREAFSNKERRYSNNVSKYIGFPVSIVLSLSSATLDTLSSFTNINKIYSVSSLSVKFCTGPFSLLNGISDFCMTGQYGIYSIDQFLGSFGKYTEISWKQAAAFSGAALASGWLSYTSIALTTEILNTILIDTGMHNVPYLASIGVPLFTACLTTQGFVVNTAAILDFSYEIVKRTTNTAGCLYKTTNQYIQGNDRGNNSFLFFRSTPDSALAQSLGLKAKDEESRTPDQLIETEIVEFEENNEPNQEEYGKSGRCSCALF